MLKMDNTLIIVESPTKAKVIKKFVGKEYEVVSSMGHVLDLPVNRFGVDVKDNFKTDYEVVKGKKKIIDEIKKLVKDAAKIYLAMDEDREGEAIGWLLMQAIGINEKKYNIDRIGFHEITGEAVRDALKNPRKINMNLVDAQHARRVLDRIVGYRISPLLSKKIRKGLSAGRVQSVGLKMVVAREKERNNFKVHKYYTVEGVIEKNGVDVVVKLWGKNGKKFSKLYLNSRKMAEGVIKEVKNKELTIRGIEEKEKKNYAPPPFITSTLQQEAYNRIGFNPEKTMRMAQQLYEGIELPDGSSSGLITYMRTDSVSIAKSAVSGARNLIKEKFGEKYLPQKPNAYRSKKSAQEAHECVRPTGVSRFPDDLKSVLSPDQHKLYALVWERFIACQMKPAVIKTISIDLNCLDHNFKATGQVLLFDGYTKIWRTEITQVSLPELEEGMIFPWKQLEAIEHETKPPARFTPATLVRELEKNGIGRPSTYASILRTLLIRKYVVLENGALVPQEISMVVVDVMEEHFTGVMDYEFTAKMEENLDGVASGKYDWLNMMGEFYEKFSKQFDSAVKNIKKIKEEKTSISCPSCGEPIVIKWGRNGKFFACSGFPKCKKAFSMDEEGKIVKDEATGMKCPKCQSPMVMKMGRYGKFLACSGYPKCRQTIAVDKEGDVINIPLGYERCPECGKDTVIRSGPKGRFLACTGYPKCRFSMELKKAEEKARGS